MLSLLRTRLAGENRTSMKGNSNFHVSSSERVQLRAAAHASQQGSSQFQLEDRLVFQMDEGVGMVLDGIAGSQCVRYMVQHLHERVLGNLDKRWKPQSCSSTDAEDEAWEAAAKTCLTKTFKEVDAEFLRSTRKTMDESACSAVFCLTRYDKVIVANIGRCSAFYIRQDGAVRRLTDLHDIDNSKELDRVAAVWRLHESDLRARLRQMPLRGFGERKLKEDGVMGIAPDLMTVEMDKGSFLLLCSQGVTDAMKDDEIGNFIVKREMLTRGNLTAVVQELTTFAARISAEDSTAILLAFE